MNSIVNADASFSHKIVPGESTWPNNLILPVVYYKQVLKIEPDTEKLVKELFSENGWTHAWVNGIYTYHHYHSTAHEVLAIIKGNCMLQIGGEDGSIQSAAPKVPVIILTGLEDTSTALESLKIGAQDYIVKDDCNALLLSKAIKYAIERKKHETEKEMLIEELMQHNTDLQQFSYITSHNLRAPLSNLIGILKLLDFSSVTDPLTLQLIKNFEECTLQLNDTVNDLINILIIKNNVNAQKEMIDVRKTFEKVIHSIKHAIDQSNVSITASLDDAYEVDFNRTYLESILLNLVTNAIKYRSPKRNAEIKVRTEQTPDGVKLYFADNGLGIDLKRYKDRIFGLYQRFHNHSDSKGLGLYIVNSQVKVMGGEIDVESEVDKGTTFIITFKNGKA